MPFACLEQRMAQSYLDMLPPFIPDENAPVSVSEQEFFYSLIKGLYQLAFDEPLLFVTLQHEDDAYPSRFKKSYGKPDLITKMKKFTTAMDALLQNMFLAGQNVAVKLNKRQQTILSRLGIHNLDKLPPAWTWMSTRPDSCQVFFTHCLFDKGYPYTSDIYARLLGEKSFRRLEGWMTGKGYKRFDIYNTTASDCKLTLTYANPAWSTERPSGGFEYKIRHTGISAQYDAYTQNPAVLGLCIPGGLTKYLLAFNEMNPEVQRFVVSRAKRCDSCRYCVQTDKTGLRPFASTEIVHKDETYTICPYFPGYRFSWTSIDDDIAEKLIETLSFMDKFVEK